MRLKSDHLFATTALCLILIAQPGNAADVLPSKTKPTLPVFTQLPAVDGINGKISGFGGWLGSPQREFLTSGAFTTELPNRRGHGLFGGMGSVSVPLGQRFGLQIDGLAASSRSKFVGGGAAHLFWRDPSVGLFGLYGSASRNSQFGGIVSYKGGVEGSLYLGRFSLDGIVGFEQTRVPGATVRFGPAGAGGFNAFVFSQKNNRFFDKIDLAYYPTDNWRVSVGHRYTGGIHMAALATEYLIPISGGTAMSAFVEGRIGNRGNNAVFGGISFYFGQKEKSLIRRHREDDPANRLLDDMFAGSKKRRFQQLGAPAVVPPPVVVPPPCVGYACFINN